ncbi:hypothetical protein MRB53_010355 [Persea americana]|uniref:Uncharacterized protein n=1 Tax=Persea americana TaxID=3435 RepID=A0ACC2LSC9_PERAE|nr:hypothetical protein MRB53_010355 [Persea americana]
MNGVSPSSNMDNSKLEDSMWHLKIQVDKQDGITQSRELPERVGQPDCQYFLKTGMCRFGATCKYHHPRDRHDAEQVPLNILGLPMRQEENSCSYYMRTGSCKFGIACKYDHPQPAAVGAVLPIVPSAYCYTGAQMTPTSGLSNVGDLPAWSLPNVSYMSTSHMQSPLSYMPVVLSPSQGMIPAQQGWSTYMSALSPGSSSDTITTNLVYNSKHLGDPVSSGSLLTSVQHFPERSDKPECRYYMKTGSCKYGSTCKYHHPKERHVPLATGTLSPQGLPLRPGQAICTFYRMYGICKYGSTCKYDHPLAGYYNYSLHAFSIPDTPLTPYQGSFQISHSSSESSPSKASKSSEQVTEPEAVGTKRQSPNKEAPESATPQTASQSQTKPISSD